MKGCTCGLRDIYGAPLGCRHDDQDPTCGCTMTRRCAACQRRLEEWDTPAPKVAA